MNNITSTVELKKFRVIILNLPILSDCFMYAKGFFVYRMLLFVKLQCILVFYSKNFNHIKQTV